MDSYELKSHIDMTGLVADSEIATNLNNVERKNIEYGVKGIVRILNKPVELIIGIDRHFPTHPPLFYVRTKLEKSIPHVDERGICYFQDEGFVLNSNDPAGIIQYCLEKTIGVIEKGLIGNNLAEYLKEFEVYGTKSLKGSIYLFANFKQEVENFWYYIGTETIFAWDRHQDFKKFMKGVDSSHVPDETDGHIGMYVQLAAEAAVSPFINDWEVNDILNLISEHCSRKKQKRLYRELSKALYPETVIIFGLKQQNSQMAYFGFLLPREKLVNDLDDVIKRNSIQNGKADEKKPIRVKIRRLNHSYLLPRAGANTNLQRKKAAIIGCGSVGGTLAFELARSGIGSLLLIDPDLFLPENLYRHVLGLKSCFKRKVSELKREIEDNVPYCEVLTIDKSIEDALVLDEYKNTITRQDLVISATGKPTIDLHVNRFFHNNIGFPPIVFTWLEAYGIGGHALLSNSSDDESGCFHCLFSDDDEFFNRASFAKPNQFFAKSISGCGSQFVPFSALDSSRTANLAARLALNYFLNRENGHPILSWKGDASEFIGNGYELSSRFNQSSQQLYDQRYQYQASDCTVCGKK